MSNVKRPIENEEECLLQIVELLSTLQSAEVQTICTDYIVANTTPKVALRLLLECHYTGLKELKDFILDTLELWTSFSLRTDLFNHTLFTRIPQELLIEILKRKFQIAEIDLFMHLIRWSLHQKASPDEKSATRKEDKILSTLPLQSIFPYVK